MIDDTFKSGNVLVNPVKVSRQDVATIYRRSMGLER